MSQELNGKIILATFFAKYVYGNGQSKPRIYVLFLFDLGGECKCIKSKAIQLLKKYVQLAATFFCKQNLLIFVQPRWQPKIGPNHYTEDSYW